MKIAFVGTQNLDESEMIDYRKKLYALISNLNPEDKILYGRCFGIDRLIDDMCSSFDIKKECYSGLERIDDCDVLIIIHPNLKNSTYSLKALNRAFALKKRVFHIK